MSGGSLKDEGTLDIDNRTRRVTLHVGVAVEMADGTSIGQELDDKVAYHALSPAEVHDAVMNAANLPDSQQRPSAWCVIGPRDEIMFLSKAKARAGIFAEGTTNTVEPLFRSRDLKAD